MSSSGVGAARYRISRRLGQGGMAEVFEAEALGELGFVRKVAIKRMLPDAAADARAAQRFLDEARIASKLHHANIVAVIDVGLLDGLPFHVLEYVDGLDAQELVNRAGGTLPLDVALAICGDVAHALDHAHASTDEHGVPLGLVHRDVKPSNVLVSWSGDVKLADFGIALARDRVARTETGIVAGTLGFIAPEQRTRSEVDGRADVFALGLTLHALVTGYTPLRDLAAELALLDGTPLELDASLPAEVRALIARAVAPSRLDRPTAGELAAAIGALRAPGDPRTAVRGFLATLVAPTRRAGALDHLLGIEVVSAGNGRFETVAASPRALDDGPTPRRRAWLPILALVVVAAGGIGVWQLATRGASGAHATMAARDGAVVELVVVDAASVEAAIADGSNLDAASLDASVVDARTTLAVTRDAAVTITRDAASARDAAMTAARDAPVTVETGWIQVVGGEALVGAQVIVDGGRWKFSVPNLHEVSTGSHRIEVLKPDGTKLPARTVEVTTFHTKRNVLRIEY